MSADTVTAKWENGVLYVQDEARLPLFLKRLRDADRWLETRAIDSHRANSRLLKKALRLAERDDLSTVIYVNGATITDNYWVKPLDSALKYSDVRFSNDCFAELALTGSYDSFDRASKSDDTKTPELTNIGSFEKCWKLNDGRWYMYKKATNEEMFSELFVCRLGQALGFEMADYEKGEGFIRTLDFTHGAAVNFEPASAFMGDDEDYEDVIGALMKLCPNAVGDYIKLIFMDTIAANPDRHTNNFGVLRNAETGEILGLAPNFDNNMALISRGYPKMPKKEDILIRLFRETVSMHPELKNYIPALNKEIVAKCIDEILMDVKREYLIELVMQRYELAAGS